MKRLSFLSMSLALSLLALASCNGNLPEPKYVVNIEGLDFKAHVNEEVRHDTASLAKVQFETVNGAYCDQTKLVAASFRNGNSIFFRIHNIEKDNSCTEATSNPSRNLLAGFLDNGSYTVSLAISQSLHYNGNLEVDDEKYILTFDDASNIFIEPSVTYRIPKGGIWFRLSYLERRTALAEECISKISDMGDPYELPNGFYSYFNMQDGEIELVSDNEYYYLNNQEVFVQLPDTSRQTLDSVYQIFKDYREIAGHQFYVDLKTWNNDVFKID